MTKKTAERIAYYKNKLHLDQRLRQVTIKRQQKADIIYLRDGESKQLGKGFYKDGETHVLLYKLYPDIIPAPRDLTIAVAGKNNKRSGLKGLVKKQKANATRKMKTEDWKKMGFKSRKEGEAFVRQLKKKGMSVTTINDLPNILSTFKKQEDAQGKILSFLNRRQGTLISREQPSAFKKFDRSYTINHKLIAPSTKSNLDRYIMIASRHYLKAIQSFGREVSTSVKWQIAIEIRFWRYSGVNLFGEEVDEEVEDGELSWGRQTILTEATFFSKIMTVGNTEDLRSVVRSIHEAQEYIYEKIAKFCKEGSDRKSVV